MPSSAVESGIGRVTLPLPAARGVLVAVDSPSLEAASASLDAPIVTAGLAAANPLDGPVAVRPVSVPSEGELEPGCEGRSSSRASGATRPSSIAMTSSALGSEAREAGAPTLRTGTTSSAASAAAWTAVATTSHADVRDPGALDRDGRFTAAS
jgi:hypothetical protein